MDVNVFKDLIWDYTRKISESANKTFSHVAEQHGLTVMQIRILMEIYKCDSHTVGSLAERICVAGANISSMCKKLEKQGLLERTRDSNDERVVKISLSEKGRESILDIDNYFNKRVSIVMVNEAEDTLEDIVQGMKKVYELLQKINKNEQNE